MWWFRRESPSESATVECSKPHCGMLLNVATYEWPQVDLCGEPSRLFCDIKCLAVWAHDRAIRDGKQETA